MPRRKDDRATLIYWLADADGLPFYCGKTVLSLHRRLLAHRYEARRGTRRVHQKVRECGEQIQIRSMETVPVGGDWSIREKRWIWILRQIYPDTCCNTADGGAGAPGWVPSAETRRKIIEANKGRKHSAETRAKISKFLTGRKWAPESVAKMSASLRGRVFSSEHCAKISATKKGKPGKPHSAERRAKISAGNKGKKRSLEQRQRMSAGQKARLVALSLQ